jgi:hypothetical protein
MNIERQNFANTGFVQVLKNHYEFCWHLKMVDTRND